MAEPPVNKNAQGAIGVVHLGKKRVSSALGTATGKQGPAAMSICRCYKTKHGTRINAGRAFL